MNQRLRISLACLVGAIAILLIGAGITAWTSERGVWVDPGGNDSSAARNHQDRPFRTLAAAKTASLAGDTIFVNPGNYTNNNLLKVGVNWYFNPGAVVYFQETAIAGLGYGIFDDRATGATTNVIGGYGEFHYDSGTNGPADSGNYNGNLNARGLVVVTNANSDVTFRARKCEINSINASGYVSAIYVSNCTNFVGDVDEVFDSRYGVTTTLTDTTFGTFGFQQMSGGIYWGLGPIRVRIGKNSPSNYGIWADEPSVGHTVSGYFTGDLMEAKIYTSCLSPNYRTWTDVREIAMRATPGTSSLAASYGLSGKHYLKAEKIASFGQYAALEVGGVDTRVWVDIEKVSSTNKWFLVSGGTLDATVQEYEDTVGTIDGGFTVTTNSTLYLHGGRANCVGKVLEHRAGTTVAEGMIFRSTNNVAVFATNSGVILVNCISISKSTSNSIYSAAFPTTVRVFGGAINTVPSANITLTGTTYTDSTLQ